MLLGICYFGYLRHSSFRHVSLLLQPCRQLPVLFVGFQVKLLMAIDFFHAAVLSVAAVAHQGVADEGVEDDINQGRDEQNAKGPVNVRVVPGDGTTQDANDHQADAQTLGKVFAYKQIGAGADQAALHPVASDNLGGDGNLSLAVGTVELARFGAKMEADSRFAGRAGVGDVHGFEWAVGSGQWAASIASRSTFYYRLPTIIAETGTL